jgi:hypothetical protein
MPGPFFDVYVLAPVRDRATVRRFLDRWAPRRELCEYLDDPEEVVLAQLADNRDERTLYWRAGDGYVMLFFGASGQLVAGLSVPKQDRAIDAMAPILATLAESLGARWGYVGFEEPPAQMFARECTRRAVALVESGS